MGSQREGLIPILTSLGSRSMRLDICSVYWIKTSIPIYELHELHLRDRVGKSETRRFAILVQARVPDDGMNLVTIFDSINKRL